MRSSRRASRGADFEFKFQTDPVNDAQPAINTQQEAFHPAFGAVVFIQYYLIKKAGVSRIGYSNHKEGKNGTAFCGRAREVRILNLNLNLKQSKGTA